MATATAMYHSGKNPLRRVRYKSAAVETVKSPEQRRLHKAFLRYHDPKHWPLLREALKRMGRSELIGDGPQQLIPKDQPSAADAYRSPRRKNSQAAHHTRTRGKPAGSRLEKNGKDSRRARKVLTQHTGLPPRRTR
jgi:hypothetical protein